MIFLVNDANILIDFLKIDLIDAFFRLDFDYLVTDLVLNEVREDNVADLQPFVRAGRLTIQGFGYEELVMIQAIKDRKPALSLPDCSCLYLSRKVSATLLTNEALLRRIAGQESLPVHGSLWILDLLVEQSIIREERAIAALTRLMEINSRLPEKECRKRLKAWEARQREI
jgi:predicted nucleic acid-binding protein